MKIGTLGAGTVAQAIARHAVAHGHQVVLSNSHGPASLAGLADELGPLAHAGTPEEAAAAELVVLAVGWPQIPDAVAGLPPSTGASSSTPPTSSPPRPRTRRSPTWAS